MASLEDFEREFQVAGWKNLDEVIAFLAKNRGLLDNAAEAVAKLRVHPTTWDAVRYSRTFRSQMAEAALVEKIGFNGYLTLVESIYKRATNENSKDAVAAAKFVVSQTGMARPQEISITENKTFRVQRAPDVDLPAIGKHPARGKEVN